MEIFRYENGAYPISVDRYGNRFRVTYGKQVKRGLTYTQAAHELGECIFHALQCEGKLGA